MSSYKYCIFVFETGKFYLSNTSIHDRREEVECHFKPGGWFSKPELEWRDLRGYLVHTSPVAAVNVITKKFTMKNVVVFKEGVDEDHLGSYSQLDLTNLDIPEKHWQAVERMPHNKEGWAIY